MSEEQANVANDTPVLEVDVLIVGAGPVGLAAAIALARMGVSAVTIEASNRLHECPQAHVVSCRSMEIFRALGVPSGELDAVTVPVETSSSVHWVESLVGQRYGSFLLASPDFILKVLGATPTPICNIPQHRLEPVLLDAARAAGADVRFGHRWVEMDESEETQTSTIDTDAGPVAIRSQFVLACDGAGSSVRDHIGAELEGPDLVQTWVGIHLAADLSDVVGADPGLLFEVVADHGTGFFINHGMEADWVLMWQYDPAEASHRDFDESRCRGIIDQCIGTPTPYEIVSIRPWRMASQVATEYRERSTFLVGDAAHRFPPTGGIGMNTGIADAHNLAWKIAHVLDGRASRDLLRTYEVERRPVALRNAAQSLKNYERMAEIEATITAGGDTQSAIDAQPEHFHTLGLDLGFAYESAAVVHDGTNPPDVANAVTDVHATTRPGHRLPHATVSINGDLASTLDLVDLNELVLLTANPEIWSGRAVSVRSIDAVDGTWDQISEIESSGALLVRPDGHIAWRAPNASHLAGLEGALRSVLMTSNPTEPPRFAESKPPQQ